MKINITNNWQFHDKISNYSKYFFFKVTIEKYLYSLFNNNRTTLNTFFIKQKSNFLVISLFIQKEKKNPYNINIQTIEKNINNYLKMFNINLFTQINIVNVSMKFLKIGKQYALIYKFYQNKKRHQFLFLINIVIFTKNPILLNYLLKKNLKNTKRHKQYLRNFNFTLNQLFYFYKNFIGYRVQLKGRINGIARSKKFAVSAGCISKNSINSNFFFDSQPILTPYGVISVKTWLVYKNVIS